MATTPYPIPRQLRQTDILDGDGGDSYGPFAFKIFDPLDVIVFARATGEKAFSPVDGVTVTKVGGNIATNPLDFFTIQFPAAVPASTKFVVFAVRLGERAAAVTSGTKLNPDALEKEISKLTTQVQELRRDVDSSIKMDFGSALAAYRFQADIDDGAILVNDGGIFGPGPQVAEILAAAASAVSASVAAIAAATAAEALALSVVPTRTLTFEVDPSGGMVDAVTIPGGYGPGMVQEVRLNEIPIEDWAATDGETVTGLGVTLDYLLPGEDTVKVTVKIGTNVFFTSSVLDTLFVTRPEFGDLESALQAYKDLVYSKGLRTATPEADRLAYSSPNLGPVALDNTLFAVTRGSAADPSAIVEPLLALKKISDVLTQGVQNPAAAFLAEKRTNAQGSRAQGAFFEAVDYAGWNGVGGNNFVEGLRTHGLIKTGATNGAAYGAISFAGAEVGVAWKFLVGLEADVANNTTDAPMVSTFDKNHFACAVLATSGFGTKKPDAGFVTNPFNTAATRFRTGFLVAEGSVDHTAFASRAETQVGLDLSLGLQAFAAIRINNNEGILAKAQNGFDHINMIYVNPTNELVLATDSAGIRATFGPGFEGRKIEVGGADSAGGGYRVLRISN